jgi:hypothetical protein
MEPGPHPDWENILERDVLIRSEAIRPAWVPDYRHSRRIGTGEDRRVLTGRYRVRPATRPACGSKTNRCAIARHESWATRHTVLERETRKWKCLGCRRVSWERLPGIAFRWHQPPSPRGNAKGSAAPPCGAGLSIPGAWTGGVEGGRLPSGAGHRRAFLQPVR